MQVTVLSFTTIRRSRILHLDPYEVTCTSPINRTEENQVQGTKISRSRHFRPFTLRIYKLSTDFDIIERQEVSLVGSEKLR